MTINIDNLPNSNSNWSDHLQWVDCSSTSLAATTPYWAPISTSNTIAPSPLSSTISFTVPNHENLVVLNEQGFLFKGELIEDAGAAYRAWMQLTARMSRGASYG